MGGGGQLQASTIDARGLQSIDLGEQHHRVDDDAVSDHGDDVLVEDPGRKKLEGESFAADHDRVARVVAALVAHDEVHLFGQDIGELALALVAPLGPNDDGGGHESS
jgi:hypothetical protein